MQLYSSLAEYTGLMELSTNLQNLYVLLQSVIRRETKNLFRVQDSHLNILAAKHQVIEFYKNKLKNTS